jgi:uncharacterized repeat protein (TIGR03943 family)
MNRKAQGIVLLLVGAAVLRASLTDLYLRYVKAGLRPLLLVAGGILILAALAIFWEELRSRGRRPDAGHETGDETGHAHREPLIAWLLVLPLLALIVVLPPALGSYAADRTGTALQLRFGIPPLPAGDPVTINLLDYATVAAFDHGRALGNRQATISGFITVGPHGEPLLTRMILNCCAADAQPIKVGLTGQVPAGLQPDAWVQVTGAYTAKMIKDDVNGGPIPFIAVSRANRISPPRDQYET